jgi:hypothetical protein
VALESVLKTFGLGFLSIACNIAAVAALAAFRKATQHLPVWTISMVIVRLGLQFSNELSLAQSRSRRTTMGFQDKHLHVALADVILPSFTAFRT